MKTAVNGTDASPVKQKTYDYDKVLADALEYFEGDELAATTWVKKYALKDNEGRLLEQSPSDMHRAHGCRIRAYREKISCEG